MRILFDYYLEEFDYYLEQSNDSYGDIHPRKNPYVVPFSPTPIFQKSIIFLNFVDS